MRLLITGGCGFIGSNFIRHVLSHYPEILVTNVDALTYAGNLANLDGVTSKFSGRYEFVQSDICEAQRMDELLAEHPYYAVINFAAESHVDRSIDAPGDFIHTNVVGTSTLLNAARRHKVRRFVQISTDEVYGSLGPEGRFTETSPLEPSSPYSASKAAAEPPCTCTEGSCQIWCWHPTRIYLSPVRGRSSLGASRRTRAPS